MIFTTIFSTKVTLKNRNTLLSNFLNLLKYDLLRLAISVKDLTMFSIAYNELRGFFQAMMMGIISS